MKVCGLCVAALLLLVSCKPGVRRPNVLLVTIDTLRADRLGCYGNSQIETPNLDRLAQRGVLFENAVAQAPLTAPSHASMMTGLYPNVHQVRDTGGFVLSPSHVTLAAILQQQGWETAAFIGSSVLKKRFGFNQGFTLYDDDLAKEERRAGEVVDRALHWLGAQSAKPFFLWVHVFDPHWPYDPPSPFREKYEPYDGEVAYTDQQLGRLFEAAGRKSAGTLTAVLSDHGESFAEHGEYAHGVFLYDTTLRIAFLIAGPGVPAGRRVKQQAGSIDLLPTLLELAGIRPPQAVQGASLVPAFSGKEAPGGWSYAETLFPKINMGWAELRAVRTNRWKYIQAPKPELYDLAQDPGETTNVISSHPAEARELQAKLTQNPEKVETAGVDPRTLEQLKSLGYLGGGSARRSYTLSGAGTDPKERLEVLRLLHQAVYSDSLAPLPQRISMLRQAIAQDPSNPSLYSNLGDLYRKNDRPAEELKLYQEAVDRGIRGGWLFSRLGSLYLRRGDKQAAIPFFEAAAQLNPSDYESLQNLAAAYRETGRMADAERILTTIVQSGEQFAAADNELGMVLFQKGDVVKAREYFEKAAALDPAYQLNLARLYKMAGDTARARAAFEAFLAAVSSRPEYRQIVPQVRKELAAIQ